MCKKLKIYCNTKIIYQACMYIVHIQVSIGLCGLTISYSLTKPVKNCWVKDVGTNRLMVFQKRDLLNYLPPMVGIVYK